MKIVNQLFHMTHHLMIIHHHTKFVEKNGWTVQEIWADTIGNTDRTTERQSDSNIPPPLPFIRGWGGGSGGWWWCYKKWRTFFSILSWCTCCWWVFPPDVACMQPNNCCQRSYFDTFQFYFTNSWRIVGVRYLVSLEIAMPEQIEQSDFNAITQTIFWPYATKPTWLRAQEEHRQIQQFQTPFPTLLHLLYYQCHPIYFV